MFAYFLDSSCKEILSHIQAYSYDAKALLCRPALGKVKQLGRTKVSSLRPEVFLILSKLQKGIFKNVVDEANKKNTFI